MNTFSAKPRDLAHQWHLVDADGVPLGRLASRVAQLIRGKHKPTFTPHMDGGDFVIVINAEKVKLTEGGRPERVIEHAVFGMLPKNSLSRQKLRGKLKVYAGESHPHAAQQPAAYSVTPLQRNA